MKKTLILSLSLLIPALLIGCTPTDKPTMVENNTTNNENVSENIVEENVIPQVMAEKNSKYSRSRKMEKPELTEMDNFNEMLNWVDKEWTRDYEITSDDAHRISSYCEKNEVEIYDEYNEWWDLQPIQTMKKSDVVKWKQITVNWK